MMVVMLEPMDPWRDGGVSTIEKKSASWLVDLPFDRGTGCGTNQRTRAVCCHENENSHIALSMTVMMLLLLLLGYVATRNLHRPIPWLPRQRFAGGTFLESLLFVDRLCYDRNGCFLSSGSYHVFPFFYLLLGGGGCGLRLLLISVSLLVVIVGYLLT
ncbi:MAG: hypothetical protein JOS17DRAFT_165117 [Linnemannia elongata]|nr:MAG: hypothetical protein JOS17DRAFT_165117 [Linnemannia elongata]